MHNANYNATGKPSYVPMTMIDDDANDDNRMSNRVHRVGSYSTPIDSEGFKFKASLRCA